jgi:TfoX/Sxy family transcriptional regulator of competence genes
MAYDVDLAERLRPLVAEVAGAVPVEEKRMFGGLAFLVAGRMVVAASGRGGAMVRVDRAEREALLARPGVEVVEMGGGREMRGWVRVRTDGLADGTLRAWVQRGVAAAQAAEPEGD